MPGDVRLFGAIDFDRIEPGQYTLFSERLYCCATQMGYPQAEWDMEWNDNYRPPTKEELDYLEESLKRQLRLVAELRGKVAHDQALAEVVNNFAKKAAEREAKNAAK